MNILIVGAGGREHTLAWKLKQSKSCDHLFIAPGNAGTALCGTNLPIASTQFETLVKAAVKHNIEMLIVGPEEPLVKGIADFFKSNAATSHIHIIGPGAEASQLEGSKAYAKAFMERHGIPTAAYREFTAENFDEGLQYIQQHSLPIVLKADGLAAGKGVLICQSHIEAAAEFELMIHRNKFGEAGSRVVIEEFLQGIEMSVFALTDGVNYVLLPEAKDYKRVGEGDTGLNTGGMGAVSPLPFFSDALRQKIVSTIVEPTVNGLKKDALEYKGFIFFGLMIDGDNPMVIEYNCRMGDPETEAVMPRLQNDLVELLLATAEQRLPEIEIKTDPRSTVAIVAVSGGYPGEHETGLEIEGLEVPLGQDSLLFHSGTKGKDDTVVTNGGRVLVVTSFGIDAEDACTKSKDVLRQIHFEGINYRRDIGYEFS
ncbi:MAG: phosphoribosylamine--glycine ligase [Chitinophagaceae bacterium]|nr:MAG: phosphoribosylamine--glycine ligase [Chitinophagaceae bacterium]